jgi:hypothetical protein
MKQGNGDKLPGLKEGSVRLVLVFKGHLWFADGPHHENDETVIRAGGVTKAII